MTILPIPTTSHMRMYSFELGNERVNLFVCSFVLLSVSCLSTDGLLHFLQRMVVTPTGPPIVNVQKLVAFQNGCGFARVITRLQDLEARTARS